MQNMRNTQGEIKQLSRKMNIVSQVDNNQKMHKTTGLQNCRDQLRGETCEKAIEMRNMWCHQDSI